MLAISTPVPIQNSTCGAHMYAQGFGTWDTKGGDAYAATLEAIKAGYRLIDCARVYLNQKGVGRAIAQAINEGIVTRKDLYIVSKVWNTDHAPEHVIASTKITIEDLQCQYLDLLLIHWPVAFEHPRDGLTTMNGSLLFPSNNKGGMKVINIPEIETWRAMEQLVEKGIVKDIGLSNFNKAEIEDILKQCKIKPVALQIELHPALPQNELREYCKQKGIVVMAYSPLGVGMPDSTRALFNNPTIKAIAKKALGSESMAPRLLLQWSSQIGCVCLTKSFNKNRIIENAKTPFGGLSEETMKELEAFGAAQNPARVRIFNPNFKENSVPFFS